jgi:hypothetical protein
MLEAVFSHWEERPDPELAPPLTRLAAWARAEGEGRRYQLYLEEQLRLRQAESTEEQEAERREPAGEPLDLAQREWAQTLAAIARAHDRLPAAPILRRLLHYYSVPPTPGSVDCLASVLSPEAWSALHPGETPAPSRGVKVTAFALRPPRGDESAAGDLCFTVTGSLPCSTAALRREAAGEAAQWCLDCWRRVAAYPLSQLDLRREKRSKADLRSGWVEQYVNGEISLKELQSRALDQERDRKGEALTPVEKSQTLRSLEARIKRANERIEREKSSHAISADCA